MLKRLFVFILFLIFFTSARAQKPADSTVKTSPVKTLSYRQYQAYLKGEDINDIGMVAEMHHFPLPGKVLKFKKELDLSPVQIQKLVESDKYMYRRKLQTGESIVTNEKTFDSLFRTKRIDEGSMIFYTQRYGQYLAEFRNAVLFACYTTQKILTPQQLHKFEALQKAD